jgi:cytochrome c6
MTVRSALAPLVAFGLGLASTSPDAADVVKGRQVYARHCASCHGPAGVPVMPGAPNLTRPEALMRADGAMAKLIRDGRMTMPGYRGILQESEIYDVIAFMRTLLR